MNHHSHLGTLLGFHTHFSQALLKVKPTRPRWVGAAVVVIIALSTAACKGHQDGGDYDRLLLTTSYDPNNTLVDAADSIMSAYESTQTVNANGLQWRVSIARQPDRSLPSVRGYDDKVYTDNRVTLTVECQGRTVVDRKTWTKQAFEALLEGGNASSYRLEDVDVDMQATEQHPQGLLVLNASLEVPGTDLFMDACITIDQGGHIVLAENDLRAKPGPRATD